MIRKAKIKNRKLISDKITELLTVQPSADIEDDQVFESKPKTLTRDELSSSDDEEAHISNFRKQNVNLLSDISKKYEGEISKRELRDDNSDSDSEGLEDTIGEDGELSDELQRGDDGMDDSNLSDDATEGTDSNNSAGESEEGFNLSQLDNTDNFTHMKEENYSDEVSKGNCVRNQLLIWENMLEFRINMQKCLILANRMPMSDTFKKLKTEGGEEFIKKVSTTENSIKGLLDKMLNLQDILLRSYPETKNLGMKSEKVTNSNDMEDPMDEEIPSDSEVENSIEEEPQEKVKEIKTQKIGKKRKLSEYSEELAKRYAQYKPYRDSVIQKWNDKTRLSVVNSKSTPSNPVLSQINYILSDKMKLIKRTQLKRSEYNIIGYEKPEIETNASDTNSSRDKKDDEYISNIYDDDDFYHQLLRELIECKTADVSDPIQLGRQWVALQQMKSKMKRKVDTKATKGRRIKYVVHPKLVNFMAPEKNLTWSEESKTELYKSLFGKVFEQNSLGTSNSSKANGFKILS